jgi:hypothetical protein
MDIDTLERLVRNCTNGIRTVNDIKASQELAELRQKAQLEIQRRYTRKLER